MTIGTDLMERKRGVKQNKEKEQGQDRKRKQWSEDRNGLRQVKDAEMRGQKVHHMLFLDRATLL